MHRNFKPLVTRFRDISNLHGRTSRATWWIGLIGASAAVFLAYYIYLSGLSRWLRKADLSSTIWALVIAAIAFVSIALLSIRRCNDMGCTPKWLWSAIVIPTLPIWVLILGTVPPNGMQAVTRGRVRISIFGAAIIGAAIFLAPSMLPYFRESVPEQASNSTIGAARSATFDCASLWNGSVATVNRAIKTRLHDAGSFEHVETIYSVEDGEKWAVFVRYRARNKFGALVQESALAVVHSDCRVISIAGL